MTEPEDLLENLDPEQRAVATIQRNAQVQSRLIEDLLDMSRIISGRGAIEMATVSLAEVI